MDNIEAVETLCRHGADPHVKDMHGNSVLDVAKVTKKDDMIDVIKRISCLKIESGQGKRVTFLVR